MNCEELAQLIPDLVDGTVPASLLAEAEAALPQCRRFRGPVACTGTSTAQRIGIARPLIKSLCSVAGGIHQSYRRTSRSGIGTGRQ